MTTPTTEETRLAELDATIVYCDAEIRKLETRRQRVAEQASGGTVRDKNYDPTKRAGLKVELEDIATELEELRDRRMRAENDRRDVALAVAQHQRAIADDLATVHGLQDLFANEAVYLPDVTMYDPAGAIHRRAVEAAERLRAFGHEVPDEIVVRIPLGRMQPRRPWVTPADITAREMGGKRFGDAEETHAEEPAEDADAEEIEAEAV